MPTNLILDIGNVICDWNPKGLIASAFDDASSHQEALAVTIGHADWEKLDQGVMTLEQGIARAQARTSLDPERVAQVYHNLGPSLLALPQSMAAMQRAHDAGVPMYILSNMPHHAWSYLAANHDCFRLCQGVVVSCEAGHVKPDAAIYAHLCERFSLAPQSCVFIDDMKKNTDAAIAFGMQAEQLTDKHAGGKLIDHLLQTVLGHVSGGEEQ